MEVGESHVSDKDAPESVLQELNVVFQYEGSLAAWIRCSSRALGFGVNLPEQCSKPRMVAVIWVGRFLVQRILTAFSLNWSILFVTGCVSYSLSLSHLLFLWGESASRSKSGRTVPKGWPWIWSLRNRDRQSRLRSFFLEKPIWWIRVHGTRSWTKLCPWSYGIQSWAWRNWPCLLSFVEQSWWINPSRLIPIMKTKVMWTQNNCRKKNVLRSVFSSFRFGQWHYGCFFDR